MAKFAFYVGREGEKAVQCVATVPVKDELPLFEGGKIHVTTPAGECVVELGSAFDMIVKQMTIELQHGVRDLVFPPKQDESKKPGKKRSTGFLD